MKATMETGSDMAELHIDEGIDWTACELVEQVPGKVSGRSIVRGTRIMPEGIVNSFDMGSSIEEIREDWPTLSVSEIERLIEFAHVYRKQSNL